MRNFRLVVLAALMVMLLRLPVQAMPTEAACGAVDDYIVPEETLQNVADALNEGGPIDILAIGSGTTVGEVNGSPGASFPYRMVDALRAALPDKTFRLTVRGGRNMTADAMLPLLQEAVQAKHYPLVLWQTGTVEAVRGMRPDSMRTVLEAGSAAVHDAHGDVVLIDPQFSRFLRANADLEPYETVLQQMAMLPGVSLFHRFDLMHSWVMDGRVDLERTRRADREEAVVLLNTCLGRTLARFVLNGAGVKRD